MRIQADFNEIQRTGNTVKSHASSYETQMQQMLARMNELQANWQGTDSQAFITKLEELRPKMLQLKTAMDTYGERLIHDANAYRTLQENRTANARTL